MHLATKIQSGRIYLEEGKIGFDSASSLNVFSPCFSAQTITYTLFKILFRLGNICCNAKPFLKAKNIEIEQCT
jgi:hypothetical protein